jgi:hypothetical protein
VRVRDFTLVKVTAERDAAPTQSVQVSWEVAPKEVETLPAVQSLQTVAPSASEYVPAL